MSDRWRCRWCLTYTHPVATNGSGSRGEVRGATVKVCIVSGCPTLTQSTRCPEHEAQRQRDRGTAAQRGYGSEHRDIRARAAGDVAAGLVRCWRCRELIKPDEPWDLGHDDKDRSQYRGPEHRHCNRATSGRNVHAAAVTIVCGPPCSGKTTWVRERAQTSDLIVDYDDIAQRLGSRRSHGHDYRFHKRVEAVISRAFQGIRDGRHERAWVIRSLPTESERWALATDLGAQVVVIDAPDPVLFERARRRPNPTKTIEAIKAWRLASGTSSGA